MALIRQAQFDAVSRGAVVLNLGDLMLQGERIKAAASLEAARIVEEGRAERQRLVAGAAEEGHRQGREEGLRIGRREGEEAGRLAALAEHREKLASLEAAWAGALERFERERDSMQVQARVDVLRLALDIAAKVTRRAARVDPLVAVEQVAAVLNAAARAARLVIRIHPADGAHLREALPGLHARAGSCAHVELAEDASLPPGSCIAQLPGGGEIDASIESQLERIAEALLPRAAPHSADPPEGQE